MLLLALPLAGGRCWRLLFLLLGILYMLFARRWLATPSGSTDGRAGRPRLRDWIEDYQLAGREQRFDRLARRAFQVAVHDGVFEEVAGGDHPLRTGIAERLLR